MAGRNDVALTYVCLARVLHNESCKF